MHNLYIRDCETTSIIILDAGGTHTLQEPPKRICLPKNMKPDAGGIHTLQEPLLPETKILFSRNDDMIK